METGNGTLGAWWIEPFIASLSFAVAIHFYWYHERKLGLSRDNNLWATFHTRHEESPILQSLSAYWTGIFLLRILVPMRVTTDGIPTNIFEIVHLSGEVVSGVVLYDALFFVIHWLMHEADVFRKLHRRHHDTYPRTVEARDVLCHSLIDGALQVICNIIVQQHNHLGYPKSRLARVLHNIVVPWMLTESHTSTPEYVFWRRWCVGVRNHRRHHLGVSKKGHESYQQFFGYLDRFRASVLFAGARSSSS